MEFFLSSLNFYAHKPTYNTISYGEDLAAESKLLLNLR